MSFNNQERDLLRSFYGNGNKGRYDTTGTWSALPGESEPKCKHLVADFVDVDDKLGERICYGYCGQCGDVVYLIPRPTVHEEEIATFMNTVMDNLSQIDIKELMDTLSLHENRLNEVEEALGKAKIMLKLVRHRILGGVFDVEEA